MRRKMPIYCQHIRHQQHDLTAWFWGAFHQWLQVWLLLKMLLLLLALFSWAPLAQASSAPHRDLLTPADERGDVANDKDLAHLLLVNFVSELVAARDQMLPELEEKDEVMRRHLSLSQRERKAGCRNFFWKTFTAC